MSVEGRRVAEAYFCVKSCYQQVMLFLTFHRTDIKSNRGKHSFCSCNTTKPLDIQ